MPFAIGENVGPYRIIEKLGQGGMATVFKAYHPALDRYVAIKVLHPAFQADANFLARFQREAQIVARQDHPNIVPIYDFAEHRGHPYLVMRFIEGETLKARLQRGPLTLEEVGQLMRAVGDALSYAHQNGVLHRDIKPSNVILSPEGQVYLTDFGLARMAEQGESTLSRDMMIGTPQYISPEQAKGESQLDARTDVYSLGVVLYEMLVGRVPFQADTPYAIIHDHIFAPLPLPRSLNPDLSEPLQRMLLKALAKDPDDRFQSAEELIRALEAALELTPAAPPPETVIAPPPAVARPTKVVAQPEKRKLKKKHRWLWAAAGLAALLCCLGILAFASLRPGRDAERLLEQARAAQEQQNFVRALILYDQVREADPHLEEAYLEGSDLLLKMGQIDRALDILLEGLDANPDSPALQQQMTGLATLAGRWEEAHRGIEWMLAEMPGDPLSHAYAGLLILVEGGPCGEARPELDTALRLDPDLPWAHYGMALCHIQEGDPGMARAELEFVLAQENTPYILRTHTEQRLAVLELGVEGAIEREFRALLPIAAEIPDDDLRMPFKDLLDEALAAWQDGDMDRAVRALHAADGWVQEHWEELGDALAGELSARMNRIIHLATEL